MATPHARAVSFVDLESPDRLDAVSAEVAPDLFRASLDAPGWVLLDPGSVGDPVAFRRGILQLGRALGREYVRRFGHPLHFVSVSRFDQQALTRPHRDGGPDGSILLLGYEPTEVVSRLYLLDHSRAAADAGLHPRDFLLHFNPTFGEGADRLRPHTQEVTGFDPSRWQVLLVNNSILAAEDAPGGMLGVLHHAVIERPRPDLSRLIDSVLMGVGDDGLANDALDAFIVDAVATTV